MFAHVVVELDIFSGMPNPTWVLTDAEAAKFLRQLDAQPRASAREEAGNLGYRGFIVEVTQGAAHRKIRVQKGTVHSSTGGTSAYTRDEGREMERWLLETGNPHLEPDLLQMVERDLR